MRKMEMRKNKSNSGKRLNIKWNIGASHCLYHVDGNFYERLERFPGALCDPDGYILFESKEDFESCPYLNIKEKVNMKSSFGDISAIPGYIRGE
jgi:hypothetical protein